METLLVLLGIMMYFVTFCMFGWLIHKRNEREEMPEMSEEDWQKLYEEIHKRQQEYEREHAQGQAGSEYTSRARSTCGPGNIFYGMSRQDATEKYRAMAKACHPDNGGSPEKMAKLRIYRIYRIYAEVRRKM